MESIFHHHVENDQVVVSDGVNRYADTIANYTHDTGGAAPPVLPIGADERVYQPTKRHAIMAGGDLHSGGPLPWNDGDAIIESVEGLLTGQAERRAAEQAVELAAQQEAAAQAVPSSITRRQLLIALMDAGIITGAEALSSAKTGEAPAAVTAMFNTLEEPNRTAAYITWASMSVAERNNPLVAMLAASQGMNDQEVDDFFRRAAKL